MQIKSMKHAKEIVEVCFCLQCGKKLIPTPSGGACIEHRLRLMPHGLFELLEQAVEMLKLPIAHAVGAQQKRVRFTIDGLPGEYRARKTGPVAAVDTIPRPRIRTYLRTKDKR